VIVNLNSSVTGGEPSSTKSLACGGVSTGGGDEEIELEKSNILLIGPTGQVVWTVTCSIIATGFFLLM
jgi:ATP-dependent protease Clp ATPase subunit